MGMGDLDAESKPAAGDSAAEGAGEEEEDEYGNEDEFEEAGEEEEGVEEDGGAGEGEGGLLLIEGSRNHGSGPPPSGRGFSAKSADEVTDSPRVSILYLSSFAYESQPVQVTPAA
jgi:hypothetical protein